MKRFLMVGAFAVLLSGLMATGQQIAEKLEPEPSLWIQTAEKLEPEPSSPVKLVVEKLEPGLIVAPDMLTKNA